AAVVHLRVETVGGVMARIRGADRLTRRVVALLAHHRPELEAYIRKVAFPVALDTDPVLRASASRLFGANGRNVVFGMTGRHARAAPRAAIEINRHSPSR